MSVFISVIHIRQGRNKKAPLSWRGERKLEITSYPEGFFGLASAAPA
jgi:hypothetical protein